MAFLIIASIFIVVNTAFLIGSLIYTLKVSKSKNEPRLSTLGSVLGPRVSLQPQVVIYEAIVRLSGNPSLTQQQLAEMTETQSKQA